jgi:large subunit ribosomal protein L7/L12
MPNPIESLPPDVVEAWRAGRKIEAIKLLREKAGAGLAEAKAAIDALERAHGKVPGGLKVKGALPEVISALAKMKATHGDATVGVAKAAGATIADLAAARDGLSPG